MTTAEYRNRDMLMTFGRLYGRVWLTQQEHALIEEHARNPFIHHRIPCVVCDAPPVPMPVRLTSRYIALTGRNA